MSKQTKIQWCDSTLNFWSGCAKVSAGCQNCYAEALSKRFNAGVEALDMSTKSIGQWGPAAPRKLHESAFKQALALNRKPWVCDVCGGSLGRDADCPCGQVAAIGKRHRRRIFSLSLGDWLDPEVPVEWLARMLDTVRQCDQVTWILCTKRPELWRARLETTWSDVVLSRETGKMVRLWLDGQAPAHVILLASVENQAMADRRVPELLRIPAVCHGISAEPLLGPVDMPSGIDWIIVGGESGPRARPCNVDWIRALVQEGQAAGVPVFVKQLGANPHWRGGEDESETRMVLQDRKGGDPTEWPADLRVRQFPAQTETLGCAATELERRIAARRAENAADSGS